MTNFVNFVVEFSVMILCGTLFSLLPSHKQEEVDPNKHSY